jgi:hypothetical protein
VSPVKYELGFYIPEDDILPHRNEILTFHVVDLGKKPSSEAPVIRGNKNMWHTNRK